VTGARIGVAIGATKVELKTIALVDDEVGIAVRHFAFDNLIYGRRKIMNNLGSELNVPTPPSRRQAMLGRQRRRMRLAQA
jgi:hypothetical protein